MPDLGIPRENIVVHLGHRLLEPLPVLHEHLRLPHDPRPRAGHRHRPQGGAPRPQGLRGHRGRRRAVDRRQPHAPHPAAQRRRHHPALQQPHLRAHQGAVLADQRARQGHQVHAAGLGRPAHQPAAPSRSAAGRPSSAARWTATSRTWTRCSGAPPPTRARRSSRSSRTATCTTDLAWNVIYDKDSKLAFEMRLEHGKPLLFGPPERSQGRHHGGRDARRSSGARACRKVPCGSTTRRASTPPSSLADLFAPDFPVPDRRVLQHRRARSTRDVVLDQEQRAISDRGPGDIAKLLKSGRHLDDLTGGAPARPSDHHLGLTARSPRPLALR